ncbi:MAG TPA: response regulator [candidate division WOR-3 bacterium]|uniref:Response regulator n=1 Tax=candidate division WOR-3 bacterium TaxID=2052148 RepID=A0A9C9K039_UNCW3|nr:response regulator [candidate division WOR-3 bacterium]
MNIRLLLIENDLEQIEIFRTMLTEVMDSEFELVTSDNLEEGLSKLIEEKFDVVLLDLQLPDIQGLDAFSRLYGQFPDAPIIVVTTVEQKSLGAKATQLGAKDFIIKEQTDSSQLLCSIQYAIDQQRIQQELSGLPLIDKPTGLYTKQSFLILAMHYLKLAKRNNRGLIVLVVEWNKTPTSGEPSQKNQEELIAVANILKQTFRRSDIISRIDEKQFAVIALEAHKSNINKLIERLKKNLDIYNASRKISGRFSLNIGTAYYDPAVNRSIAELLSQARKVLCCIPGERRTT